MKKMNWGILGSGRISGWFCTALRTVENANILAAGSRSFDKAKEFAQQYDIERNYGSYEDLVADPDIDVIYIGVPTRYHYETILLCLRAGKPVVCEKSFTVNAKQAKEVIALAQEKKLFLMEAMWTKCQPVFLQVKNWVDTGRIGEIKLFKAEFFTPGKADPPHRLYNHSIAGGAMLDLTVYPITYACALMGVNPVRVHSAAYIGETNVDIDDSVVMQYENGGFAHICAGFNANQQNPAMVIGTKGKIKIDHCFLSAQSAQLYDLNDVLIDQVNVSHQCNGYEYEAREATRCLQNGQTESKLIALDDTLAVIGIMDECRRQWNFKFDFE